MTTNRSVFSLSTIAVQLVLHLLLASTFLSHYTVAVEAVDGQLIQRLCRATISPSTCLTCIKSQIPPLKIHISSRSNNNNNKTAARTGFLSESKMSDQHMIGGVVVECATDDVDSMSSELFGYDNGTADIPHLDVIEHTCLPGYENAIQTVNDIANGEIQRGMYRQARDRINGQVRPWVNRCAATFRARRLGVPPLVNSLTPVVDLKYRIATQVLDGL